MGKITNGWNFSKEDGFSGSCGSTPVKGYMRGGHVKSQRTAAPMKHPEPRGAKATVHHGATTPHRFARGGNVRPHEVEHRDYTEYNKPHDEAVYPEVGTRGKPAGYRHGGHAKHKAEGGEVTRDAIEHDEGAKRGGHIVRKAHGGHVDGAQKAARAHLKAHRQETEHHTGHTRNEHQKAHEHGGKAKAKGGHSTPHPYAMGGLARPANPSHRMMGRRPPMVSPLAAGVRPPMMGAPAAPQMGSPMGLKHGGRSRK